MNKNLKAMMFVVTLGFVPSVFCMQDANDEKPVATKTTGNNYDRSVPTIITTTSTGKDADKEALTLQVKELLKELIEAKNKNKAISEVVHVNGHNNSMGAIIKDEMLHIFRTCVHYSIMGTALVASIASAMGLCMVATGYAINNYNSKN